MPKFVLFGLLFLFLAYSSSAKEDKCSAMIKQCAKKCSLKNLCSGSYFSPTCIGKANSCYDQPPCGKALDKICKKKKFASADVFGPAMGLFRKPTLGECRKKSKECEGAVVARAKACYTKSKDSKNPKRARAQCAQTRIKERLRCTESTTNCLERATIPPPKQSPKKKVRPGNGTS